MGAGQVKKFVYDGNACMLYDYMVAQEMKEKDVLHMLRLVENDGELRAPIDIWIQKPNSIPMYLIPALCRVLNAPIEAIFMKSRILNGKNFSIYGKFVRAEKQRIEDIPSEILIQELKKRGFKVFGEV